MIVVDTNVLLYASVTGSFTESAWQLFRHDSRWYAPSLWRSEYRNVMAGYLRRDALTREQVNTAFAKAAGLVNGFETDVDTDDVFDLIESSHCTAYDCEFVALAKRLACPLVTMDKQLLRAFPDIAIPLTDLAHRMRVDEGVSLKPYNSFGLPASASTLVRVTGDADVREVVDSSTMGRAPKFILGGGSNVVLTRDMPQVVLKVEVTGKRLVEERPDAYIVEAGAGEDWHGLVMWTLDHGFPGLENMAMIPGTVGASPVQNIGAYGVELQDRFESLDAVDLVTGRSVTIGPGACAFGYRDSVFKHMLAGRSLITRVRFRLPRPWRPVLGYLELERKVAETGCTSPTPHQVAEWIMAIRRGKLPNPAELGNAGSFFKNPVVTPEQCRDIIGRDPEVVHYPLPDGSMKLAAGWLIDACGWKGKTVGKAGVYEKQALVLVNRGGATGSEVLTLARAIQESVYGRFGIRLETEPVVV